MGPGVVKHAGTGYITIAAPTPVFVQKIMNRRADRVQQNGG